MARRTSTAGKRSRAAATKAVGRIDRRDGRRPDAPDQLGGQGARTAADIEHPRRVGDRSEVREHRSERRGVPAHETVVRIGSNRKAHNREPTPD